MPRPATIAVAIVGVLSSTTATVHAQQLSASPFAPGGPLAPWVGPLPTPPVGSAPAAGSPADPRSQPDSQSQPDQSPPASAPPYGIAAGTTRGRTMHLGAPVAGVEGFGEPTGPAQGTWPSAPANPPRTDRHWEPVTSDEDRQTYVAVTVNPALMALGKTSGRLEIAPLAAHAAFLEVSRLSLYIDDVGRTVSGTEIDVGYHLFPQGKGAHGFYLGPRYLFGSGEIPEASWEFRGVGGDLGYQWVIAHHLVFNLGAGVARVDGKAELNEDEYDDLLDQLDDDDADAFRSLSTQEEGFWIPIVTVGLGLAI